MKIKKYTGENEKEAMIKVKDELGSDALIVSVKRIKPKGIYKLFRKPFVEVTAASDEKSVSDQVMIKNDTLKEESTKSIEMKALNKEGLDEGSFIHMLRELSRRELQNDSHDTYKTYEKPKPISVIDDEDKGDLYPVEGKKSSHEPYLSMIYEQMLDNEVDEKIINELMTGLEELASDNEDIDTIIGTLYKRIVKKLSDVEPIQSDFDKKTTAVFVGPTGVGKTTTIAKIASYFTLNLGKKVALITSDTYRIAAVEQLRTYANILNIPIKVVYNIDEMDQALKEFEDMDLILIDTAGRSHRHEEHLKEIHNLLRIIPEKEVYLVLSMATKYKDLLKICDVYDSIDDFKLIFTKLDETSSYGNIINIKERSGAKLSYVTFGQNVPDDISEFDTHDIAKKTLGGCEI